MPPTYFIWLAAALLCVWACWQISEEIHLIVVVFTGVVCFIIGIALAPLSVQLIVALVLMALCKFYRH
jgi:hypothetical protein